MARPAITAFVLLALLACGARPASATPSTDNCTAVPGGGPVVITNPGNYCVNDGMGVLMEFGAAITVNADNVVIDCFGNTIDNDTGPVNTSATGILANDRRNVVVRNCKLDGFYRGIWLQGAANGGGHVVEGNRTENSRYVGIQVEGDGSIVRNNRVYQTGGSSIAPEATGIHLIGAVDALDNDIDYVGPMVGGNGFGIVSLDSDGGSISGNRIRRVLHGASAISAGIYAFNHGRLALRGNDLVGDANAADDFGLLCGSAAARARDNVLSGFSTAMSDCGNASGNVTRP